MRSMNGNQEPERSGGVWVTAVYLLLLAVIVPWYWPEDDIRLSFGVPMWVLASLAGLAGAAVFTAWLYARDIGQKE